MLQIEKTVVKFGYNPMLLSSGSNKKIIVTCDYCQQDYERIYKGRDKANEIINKDACIKCRFKKREEISLKLYGVKNSAQREDIRTKISEASSDRLKSDAFKEQAKTTNLKKYGNEIAMRSEIVQDRLKQTIQNKYGVDNISQLEYIRDKAKQTCLEKYGNIFPSKTEIGKSRIIAGFQEKYGCDNAFQNEEIKAKIKQTVLDKYGVDSILKSQIVKDGVINKYGVDNVFKSKEIQLQIKQTNIKKYGYENPGKNSDIIKKGINTKINSGQIEIYQNKRRTEWAKETGYSRSNFDILVRKHGFEKAIKMSPTMSSLERLFKIWLDEEHISYQTQFRVENRIADFKIDNLLIELDGLYWHSDAILEDKNYHVSKRQLYIDNGYKPLFFRENELINPDSFEIVKSIIRNKLGKSNRIFARKCEIRLVDKNTAKRFFNQNHLMGYGAGDTYGLFYEGKLVSAILIKKIKGGYEISRFCHILNTNVIGGFSKLVHFAKSQIVDNQPLTTFIDLRYGSGDYLSSLGFVYQHTFPSFKWTDGIKVYNRMKFPSMSGYDNGLFKLWDCGQAKYISQ